MKARSIFTILFLSLSCYVYSQIADGVYPIRHLGHLEDKQANTHYNEVAPEGSKLIFYKNNIYVTIGNYRVDILIYDDKETNYNDEMAKIKAFSYFDNIEKTVFIQKLEGKGMYMLWLGRGNGSCDNFLFTTSEFEE